MGCSKQTDLSFCYPFDEVIRTDIRQEFFGITGNIQKTGVKAMQVISVLFSGYIPLRVFTVR